MFVRITNSFLSNVTTRLYKGGNKDDKTAQKRTIRCAKNKILKRKF